jgi:hypothetical protein
MNPNEVLGFNLLDNDFSRDASELSLENPFYKMIHKNAFNELARDSMNMQKIRSVEGFYMNEFSITETPKNVKLSLLPEYPTLLLEWEVAPEDIISFSKPRTTIQRTRVDTDTIRIGRTNIFADKSLAMTGDTSSVLYDWTQSGNKYSVKIRIPVKQKGINLGNIKFNLQFVSQPYKVFYTYDVKLRDDRGYNDVT